MTTTPLNCNPMFKDQSIDVATTLDRIHSLLLEGKVGEGIPVLFSFLDEQRSLLGSEDWEELVKICLTNRISSTIFEEPMTARAFRKPRGYPGDAELLDFIYGMKKVEADPRTSPIGKALHSVCYESHPTSAVRTRRRILADLVDATARGVEKPRILSVAAGHLREAELSLAVQSGSVGEYIAFDQDPLSLEVVERVYGRFGVRTDQGSVRDILAGKRCFGGFDLVYSAGLYDYLQEKTAQRLTALLFQALRPGGKLLVANFLPGVSGRGYMECFMGWKLIYRNIQELFAVAAEVPRAQVMSWKLFEEETGCIAFLEIKRKA